jgi:cytochrome c oxidase subunit II
MFQDLPLFPRQASTIAGEIDGLFLFILGVTLFFTLLIATLIVYFAVRYRRRSEDDYPSPIIGSTVLEAIWTAIPFCIAMLIFFWGASVYFQVVRPPDDCLEIYVVGRQWMWKAQHPDGQREINELHIPVGRPVKLIMTSEDVIHSFYVPAFRVKQDVLPGRYTRLWFEATKPDRYHLFCAEYCGTGHSTMGGWVVALPPDEYQQWLSGQAEGSLALQGRKLFLKKQCITCHTGTAEARAPNLEALFGKTVRLQDGGSVVADENYLRESILVPDAKVVAGYQPIMPSFKGQVSEEELIQLIGFIKALQPGQMPTRTEETPPPTVAPPR